MISARCEHTCGLHDDGTLWCWGQNNDAQLGDGTATKRNVPTQVGTATTWTNVVTNYYNTCAQQSDATTWCWGDNQFGQLGTGVVGGIRATPGLLSSATPWRTISIGGGFMCGIQTDGSLWCWGDSSNGQLGLGTAPDGTPIGASVPTQVGTDHDWSVLSAGFFHACAIKTDGSLWCWGGNLYGAVGDGTEIDRSTPLKVGTGTWKTVDGGSWYTCGIKSGGTLWCWGINEWGNLGDGTTTSRSAPVPGGHVEQLGQRVGSGPSYVRSAVRSLAVVLGGNFEGQLGDGTTMDHHAPIAVASFTSWASVAASSDDYSCALATDHSLWCWGFNGLGGLATAAMRHQPAEDRTLSYRGGADTIAQLLRMTRVRNRVVSRT